MSRPGYIYIVILPDKSIWNASTAKYAIINAIRDHKLLNYEVIRMREYDHIYYRDNDLTEFKVDITEEVKQAVGVK